MRICPKCGYLEPEEWKPTAWKVSQFIDCIRRCELERIDKELFDKVTGLWPKDYLDAHYAYKISKTGVWVLRRWRPIYMIQGWKDIPAENAHMRRPRRRVRNDGWTT